MPAPDQSDTGESALEPGDPGMAGGELDAGGGETMAGSQRRSPAERLRGDRDGAAPDQRQAIALANPSWPGDSDADPEAEPEPRQLHPLPKGLVELYGLLAVLFVLVPEWMASGALFGFGEGRRGSELPAPSGAWKRLPELRLASLNLAELRQLAHGQGVIGYSRQSRQELTARLLRRLRPRR